MSRETRKLAERDFAGAHEGERLTIEVAYEKGGMNFLTGTSGGRGYYLRVRPETVKDGMRSFTLFEGIKALVEPAARFSEKKLATVTPDPALVDKLVAKVLADRAERNAREAARRREAPTA